MLFRSSVKQNQIDERMVEVQNQCQILSSKIARTGYLSGEDKSSLNSEIETIADVYNGRIVVVNQDFKIVQDTFHISESRLHIAETVIRSFQGETVSRYNRDKHYFAQAMPIYSLSPDKHVEGVLVMTASTEAMARLTESVGDRLVLFQVILVLVLVLAAVLAAAMMVRPFKEFQAKLHHVEQGALDTDISSEAYRETRDISNSVAQTITKLQEADQSRQEFVSNVSHELKTPLTSMKVLADSLLAQENVPIELYQEFMGDIAKEIDRENDIISDLLTLVKMDKTVQGLNIRQININELLEAILKRLKPIADKKKIEVVLESFRPVSAEIDEMKLTLAISNLVENAIKYNRDEGWVRVSLNADHKYFYVKVMDSGIGIPEEDQAHIFERFYRVDKSHSREIGGTGLGLAIARNAVIMHRGSIKVYSSKGEGTTFTVRIPLTYAA